ncbi:fibronectin type III domain-containing protein [Micromonospora sp. WMMD1082]|uniref:fibronectin type III domain-containing protein n=1 Tax=Micromonospora sp. WMMD1082 TaxID=3016104 RepID=UPI002416F24C|nr:fibronectin type III domain-containing protein [Micromonospora sp. WMMD1082]MDG4793720.1 fibronectin type III domain-containing protein [Micromonospora sp. WMMD1082]
MHRPAPRLIVLVLATVLAGFFAPVTPASGDPLVPLPAPGQPLATEVTATSAVLTWSRPDGPVFRYSMQRLVDGAWQGYASMPGTSYALAALTPDTEYTFAVYAAPLAGAGYSVSPLSEPVTFRTLPADFTCAVRIGAGRESFAVHGIVPWSGVPPWPWRATFTIAPHLTVTQVWNGSLALDGTQAFLSGGWGTPPATGTPIEFGFHGRYTGDFTPPRDFFFTGIPCEVQTSTGPPRPTP